LSVSAQTAEKEPVAILEVGAAAGRSISDGTWNYGPSVSVEVTPIEHWLELEAGVTPLFTRRSAEVDTDLLFKKPWDISRKLEFMAGIGPEWVYRRQNGVSSNGIAGEAALDFMIWPARKHNFGVYFEPAYDRSFSAGHEQSVGITGGLLIAMR
jgi:hypothetical protein